MLALKFGEVVERGRLNVHSAQHVLKHADRELGLPESGSQGVHRRFTLQQATRLAMAAKLIGGWVRLDGAARTVLYCEQRVRNLSRAKPNDERLYKRTPSDPWRLHVLDERYAQAWCYGIWRRRTPVDWADWFVIVNGGRADELKCPKPITRFEVNLTLLESALAGECAADVPRLDRP